MLSSIREANEKSALICCGATVRQGHPAPEEPIGPKRGNRTCRATITFPSVSSVEARGDPQLHALPIVLEKCCVMSATARCMTTGVGAESTRQESQFPLTHRAGPTTASGF